MREVEQAAEAGNHRALVALKAFSYRVRKYIGAYLAAMGGLDVLIFTGGIGQGSAGVRSLALQGLQCMGIHLDEQRNRDARGFAEICRISTDDSPVTVLVVPTDEERMIARETLRALSRSYLRRVLGSAPQRAVSRSRSPRTTSTSRRSTSRRLFGPGHQLTRHSDLSQPGQYRLPGTAHDRRAQGPRRARARAGADAQSHPGGDRDDRAVQARHPPAHPRIRRPPGHARLHARRPGRPRHARPRRHLRAAPHPHDARPTRSATG